MNGIGNIEPSNTNNNVFLKEPAYLDTDLVADYNLVANELGNSCRFPTALRGLRLRMMEIDRGTNIREDATCKGESLNMTNSSDVRIEDVDCQGEQMEKSKNLAHADLGKD
ncbi:hypothetical protein HAX54_041634 [Datura stramonium]|uniref:Uncharacterized protein n=1 Tax=Datura stramonium TaxID=4076 RepID=A0ABS8VZP7_DATST|nr:hypothetical protein [Datura stramonium]